MFILIYLIFIYSCTCLPIFVKSTSSVNLQKYLIVLKNKASSLLSKEWLKKHSIESHIQKEWNRPSIKGYSLLLSDDMIPQLLASHKDDTHDYYIQKENVFKANAIQSNAPWSLSRISHHKKMKSFLKPTYEYPDSSGRDVDVYILDSGIDIDHPEFEGRAIWGTSFHPASPHDAFGHGTHVAGIVASKSFGVAKEARVIAVQVLNEKGEGTSSDIIQGIHYVIDQVGKNPSRKAIINMSFSGPIDTAVDQVLSFAVEKGIPVVVAAGNEGDNACQYSPGKNPHVYTIAASDPDDQIAFYSNSGPCVNLVAPGSNITSLWPGNSYKTLDGTSGASPHAAGVLAILMTNQASVKSPSELYALLDEISTPNALQSIPENTSNKLLYTHQSRKDRLGMPL